MSTCTQGVNCDAYSITYNLLAMFTHALISFAIASGLKTNEMENPTTRYEAKGSLSLRQQGVPIYCFYLQNTIIRITKIITLTAQKRGRAWQMCTPLLRLPGLRTWLMLFVCVRRFFAIVCECETVCLLRFPLQPW